jgi:hypothetical protein
MPGALRSIWWFLSIPVTLVLLVVGYASLVSGNLIGLLMIIAGIMTGYWCISVVIPGKTNL